MARTPQDAVPAPDEQRAGGAFRTVMRIFDRWGLTPGESMKLLALPRATYYRWRETPPRAEGVPRDTLERLSYILGIYKALHILLPREEVANAWVSHPNDGVLFQGARPLDRMLRGNVADLYEVRRYLDGQRG